MNPESPLNPRQVLRLGRPQDRTGSPILGDFEVQFPQSWGLGGLNHTGFSNAKKFIAGYRGVREAEHSVGVN